MGPYLSDSIALHRSSTTVGCSKEHADAQITDRKLPVELDSQPGTDSRAESALAVAPEPLSRVLVFSIGSTRVARMAQPKQG